MAAKKIAATPPPVPVDPLQQLYSYLDASGPDGNTYFAWYAQLRAREFSHVESIKMTIAHFGLDQRDWWKARDLPPL